MIASAVLLLLPWDILGRARGLSELAAVPQAALTAAKDGMSGPLGNLVSRPAITAEEHARLVAQLDATQNENASLAARNFELQAQISDLTHIRKQGFPERGRLIPAKVIAADAVASRSSLKLSRGSMANVKTGDWVTSRRFVDAGAADGVPKGAGVLARESLIGWVEDTDPLTSRVVLLSDSMSRSKMVVNIGRVDAKTGARQFASFDGKPAGFALEGAGRGLMRIPDLDADWVKKGIIRVGDIVTSDSNDAKLPVAMVIGEITALEPVRDNKKKPLYYRAMVKHRYDPQRLSQVFIADFSRQANGGQ
jgi:cell shape-determining protein MreC